MTVKESDVSICNISKGIPLLNRQLIWRPYTRNSLVNSKGTRSFAKMAIILGADGKTAGTSIQKLGSDGRDYKVLAFRVTINNSYINQSTTNSIYYSTDNIKWVDINVETEAQSKRINKRRFIDDITQSIKSFGQTVQVTRWNKFIGINLFGGANSNYISMEELNYEIPLIFLEHILKEGKELSDSTSLIHISSVATTINSP